jgi:hypothetical protein
VVGSQFLVRSLSGLLRCVGAASSAATAEDTRSRLPMLLQTDFCCLRREVLQTLESGGRQNGGRLEEGVDMDRPRYQPSVRDLIVACPGYQLSVSVPGVDCPSYQLSVRVLDVDCPGYQLSVSVLGVDCPSH